MYSRWLRNSFIYLLILVAVIAIVFAFFSNGDDLEKVPFGEVVQEAQANNIQKIEVDGRNLEVTYASKDAAGKPRVVASKMGENTDLEQLLTEKGVVFNRELSTATQPALDLEYKDGGGFGPWLGLLLNVLPFLLFGLYHRLIRPSRK